MQLPNILQRFHGLISLLGKKNSGNPTRFSNSPMFNPRLAPASLSSRDDSRCAVERTAGTVGTVGIGGAAGFTCDDKGVDTGGF